MLLPVIGFIRAENMALKELRVFSTTWEAGMAKSLLEGEGINAVVADDIVLPYLQTAGGGVKLMVDESEFERADEILADWEASTALEEPEGEEEPNKDGDEPCEEPDDQTPDGG
jgi:hypothetical protein